MVATSLKIIAAAVVLWLGVSMAFIAVDLLSEPQHCHVALGPRCADL